MFFTSFYVYPKWYFPKKINNALSFTLQNIILKILITSNTHISIIVSSFAIVDCNGSVYNGSADGGVAH